MLPRKMARRRMLRQQPRRQHRMSYPHCIPTDWLRLVLITPLDKGKGHKGKPTHTQPTQTRKERAIGTAFGAVSHSDGTHNCNSDALVRIGTWFLCVAATHEPWLEARTWNSTKLPDPQVLPASQQRRGVRFHISSALE